MPQQLTPRQQRILSAFNEMKKNQTREQRLESCLESLLERFEDGDGLSKEGAAYWADTIREVLGRK